ncbi:ferritin-like domain-containing protein [Actinoplanes sp. NPDC023714]|uniref:ferritin-like domain-containing protein n=1 Tax=Actinoplanes sp. NPDC023714 TaxID=3154322 RepID=UPI0033F31C20
MTGADKIYPRNLTARADHQVRGNPASTRPESGVDNCYPGLEFDQRNLDKQFFPGLVVEFHRNDGALITGVAATGLPAERGLTAADLPLAVWAVGGRTEAGQSEAAAPTFSCTGLNGLEVWRRVHDLMPGRIALLLGPGPGFSSPGSDPVGGNLNGFRLQNRSLVQRDQAGRVEAAVLVADRARYLDPDGVIDPDAYPPGELTRSLCAPWQFDFRDCGCFYWAASKPDIVTSSDGRFPNLNFQRRDRTSVPPPADQPTMAGRREQELDYPELILDWNVLPVVVNDRESDAVAAPPPVDVPEMTRDEVIEELTYLATVEHALAVEYLFAHLSLDAPMRLPESPDDRTRRIHAAATEVFSIAVDEMRHLRWANEALTLLGAPPSLGRAERIGRSLDRPFALEPLTPEQLAWFIEVERPSQVIGTGVDGMYVRLHTTVDRRPDLFPDRERIVHLLKLIIDEGDDHFHRFTAVQGHLAGLDPADYLREFVEKPADELAVQLQELADQNYTALLTALRLTFALGDAAGGLLIEQSRRAMFNLHETNHVLAARGILPRFALPASVTQPGPPAPAGMVADLAASLRSARDAFAAVGGPGERALVLRQAADHEALVDQMLRLTDEHDLG